MLNKDKIKGASLVALMLVLLFPLAQQCLNVFKLRPLAGYFETVPNPEFRKRAWLNGTFQEEKEKYLNQNHGLKSFLVRLHNQLDYWFYNKSHANKVLCGKDGVFYEESYIKSYLGMDFLGEDSIKRTIEKLKFVQESLAAKNKSLLIVMAPGKGSFYPDNFPNPYSSYKKATNNYDVFSKKLVEEKINTIDFNGWFMSQKGKTKYPLMTELGIHWTIYGATLAFDSIAKYMEVKRNIDLPDIVYKGFQESDTLWSPDGDIYEASNLLVNMKHQKTAYPIVEVNSKGKQTPPGILTVGDSFWWNIYNTRLTSKVFSDGRFWYYNNQAFPESYDKTVLVSELNFNEVIDKADVIVLCYTESNLNWIGGNIFIDQLKSYCAGNTSTGNPDMIEQGIKKFTEYIKSDKKWMKAIEERAKKENRSVDSLIYLDAKWEAEHYKEK